MVEKINRALNRYYRFSLLLIIVSIIGTVYYFWEQGFIDGSRGKTLHEANYILDGLKSQKDQKRLLSNIEKEQYRDALKTVEKIEKHSEKLDQLVKLDSFQNVREEAQRVKVAISNLISFQKTDEILNVYSDKLSRFLSYVEKNNWRTLTRFSRRLKSHLSSAAGGNLDSFTKKINKDLDEMTKITQNSVLSRAQKSEIVSRLESLRTEIKMLSKFSDEKQFFESVHKVFSSKFDNWLIEISPELTGQRIHMEQLGKYFVFGMFGVLSLASFFFFSSFFFAKSQENKKQVELEAMIEEIISNKILENEQYEFQGFSHKFKETMDSTSEYVNKRMSFGSIFQEAMPFAAIMFDMNLKVEWANKQFCEDWGIEEDEIHKDYISWDYLSKLTNLGHDDPVLEALKHDIAGIYQIQVKASEEMDSQHHEMFVSPVKYNGSKKIMLFFYPLASLQETIQDQAKSIITPIEKTLNSLLAQSYDNEIAQRLEKDYEIAGIKDIHKLFQKLNGNFINEKQSFKHNIDALYSHIEQLQMRMEKVNELNISSFKLNRDQIDALKDFKKDVIGLSSHSKEMGSSLSKMINEFERTLERFDMADNRYSLLRNSMEDMTNSLPNFDNLKDDLKAQKSEVSEAKSRLAHSLSQFVHLKKRISSPDTVKRFDETFTKTAQDLDHLDKSFISLEKRLLQLEVLLSKTQMIVNTTQKNVESSDKNKDAQFISQMIESYNYVKADHRTHSQGIDSSEAGVVENLQNLYQSFKKNLGYQSHIGDLLVEDQKQDDEYGRGHQEDKAVS